MGNVLYKDVRYECRRFHRECLYSVIEDVVIIVLEWRNRRENHQVEGFGDSEL